MDEKILEIKLNRLLNERSLIFGIVIGLATSFLTLSIDGSVHIKKNVLNYFQIVIRWTKRNC
jgi:hypothetical protein